MGRPRGLAVKCARSAAGGPGSDPRHALTHRFSSHAEATSHIQQLEGCATMTYNYLLGLWGKKKEEDWQEMLTQSWSSSAKRGGLARMLAQG